MSDEPQVLVRREGDVLHATLSNAARRNAITWSMYDRLLELCAEVDTDDSVRLVVLRGAGRAFAAGTDIGQFRDFTDGSQGVAYEHRVARVLEALLGLRVPVLGVVEGPAVGAGLAIAATCDVLMATPEARFGVPIARTLGNCIPPAVLARLQHRVGAARTMTMVLTSQLMGAEEARTSGFVHAVVPAEDLDEHVDGLVRRMAGGAPLTLAAMKEMDRRLHASALAVQADDLLDRCYGSADFREGVHAFLEHRTPTWKGR